MNVERYSGSSATLAEKVNVKYRGEAELGPFTCHTIQQSSFVNRVCYDSVNSYMLIALNGIYYHYCAIDAATVNALCKLIPLAPTTIRTSKGDLITG